jgi:hypothetical protein
MLDGHVVSRGREPDAGVGTHSAARARDPVDRPGHFQCPPSSSPVSHRLNPPGRFSKNAGAPSIASWWKSLMAVLVAMSSPASS